MSRFIDLHCHSTASDGTWAAQDVVREAARLGLAAISIVDHDTTAALAQAVAEGKICGVEVVPGLEISARWEKADTLHILGYYFRPEDAGLQKGLETFRAARDARNPQIVKKLRDCGLDICIEDVLAEAKGEAVGRPHIASALLKKGCVDSIEDAFVRYLKRGARAYVPKDAFPPQEAIALIRSAGGVAVLAHPKYLNLSVREEQKVIEQLVAQGLEGIEAYYSGHSGQDTARYLALAKRLNLAVTGGTDFHGQVKPDIWLGTGFGNLKVPLEALESLKAKVRKIN